jgi:hypothetical protein
MSDLLAAHVALDGSIDSPAQARALVADLLRPEQQQPLSDVARLLTSELVTGAVLRASSRVAIDVQRGPDTLRVEVEEAAPEPPAAAPPAFPGAPAWGLRLVEELADDWGTEMRDEGIAAWFELRTGRR